MFQFFDQLSFYLNLRVDLGILRKSEENLFDLAHGGIGLVPILFIFILLDFELFHVYQGVVIVLIFNTHTLVGAPVEG